MPWNKRLLACSLLLLAIHGAAAQESSEAGYTTTTVAGTAGVGGTTEGQGAAARFFNPYGIAVDGSGNLYVADTYAGRLRKITPDGVVSTLAGIAGRPGINDGPAKVARFFDPGPYGVAVDKNGNVYAADTFNNIIRKISPDGDVTTFAGKAGNSGDDDGTGSVARFKNPCGVAVGAAGNVYVADTENSTIRKITPDRVVTTIAGLAGDTGAKNGDRHEARFANPKGVAVDGAGNIYVADTENHLIRKITPEGKVRTLARMNNKAERFSDTGLYGIAADEAGNVYVPDLRNDTIRKITPEGVITVIAGLAGSKGGEDGPGSTARFDGPRGIAVDAAGNLYVADTDNCTIRKISPTPRP